MHDVRDLQWPGVSPFRIGSRVLAELRAMAHGMGVDPTSYLRRAVRPDELFFVTSFADSMALARRAVQRSHRAMRLVRVTLRVKARNG